MDDYYMSKQQRSPLLADPPAKRSCLRSWSSAIWSRGRIFIIVLLSFNFFINVHYVLSTSLRRPSFANVEQFPKKIWQSWKVDPLNFDDRDIERARSWTKKNPSHRYEVLTDDNAVPWVELHFGPDGYDRPDIVATYRAMSAPNTRIIQADMLRYMLLYVEGGIWADIDVEALRPIDTFIPQAFEEKDVNMIIGVETDQPDFLDHPFLGAKAQSFVQWTFMCKPRLPVMLTLIEGITIWVNQLAAQQGRLIHELELDFDTVLLGTGPSAFTKAILDEMSIVEKKKITWDTFHDMDESKAVGGILVLPSEAFAAGTGHSDSGVHNARRALVKHHYHASSWATDHARYRHPIYEEVERCNWNKECVKLWDANTAFFNALPQEEQLKMIEMKQMELFPMEQQPAPAFPVEQPAFFFPQEQPEPAFPPEQPVVGFPMEQPEPAFPQEQPVVGFPMEQPEPAFPLGQPVVGFPLEQPARAEQPAFPMEQPASEPEAQLPGQWALGSL